MTRCFRWRRLVLPLEGAVTLLNATQYYWHWLLHYRSPKHQPNWHIYVSSANLFETNMDCKRIEKMQILK